MESSTSFITLARQRDRQNRVIILLHSDSLPATSVSRDTIQEALRIVPTDEQLTLVYLHGGLASTSETSLFSVRHFRSRYEQMVPLSIRSRIQQIVALHVSFSTRAHVYASTFQMECSEYRKLVYCDLIEDLERLIGIDSTLLGMRNIDFDYDEQMRHWVGRQDEGRSEEELPKALDPSKPLMNTEDVSFSVDDEQSQEASRPRTIEL